MATKIPRTEAEKNALRIAVARLHEIMREHGISGEELEFHYRKPTPGKVDTQNQGL
jgi:fructose-1,6-bisphosphatase/inositol monophosphatase family enzyme